MWVGVPLLPQFVSCFHSVNKLMGFKEFAPISQTLNGLLVQRLEQMAVNH